MTVITKTEASPLYSHLSEILLDLSFFYSFYNCNKYIYIYMYVCVHIYIITYKVTYTTLYIVIRLHMYRVSYFKVI